MVSLTKIVEGKPVISDTLPDERVVRCPRCFQTYRLGYSEGEWHKVSTWLNKAETAMRESHKRDKHERDALELIW